MGSHLDQTSLHHHHDDDDDDRKVASWWGVTSPPGNKKVSDKHKFNSRSYHSCDYLPIYTTFLILNMVLSVLMENNLYI